MVDKKQRPHELKDAAAVETYWIEPIHSILPASSDSPKIKKHSKKSSNHEKRVEMREDKKNNQHTFKHDHENRKTLPRGQID